jgi:thiamine kinase-like enzyme
MSQLQAPKTPAWPGLIPNPTQFEPAPESHTEHLLDLLQLKGSLYYKAPLSDSLCGYYRLTQEDGSGTLFLKILEARHLESQMKAAHVSEWLNHCGVRVSSLLPEYPKRISKDLYVFAFDWLDTRFAELQHQDLQRFGTLLGNMHAALQKLPWQEKIRNRSKERDRMLRRQREALLEIRDPQPRLERAIDKVLRDASTDLPTQRRQVIHADLNLGNVLYKLSDGKPAVIDFEQAINNWQSPMVDVALALQRFVLVRTQDSQSTISYAKTFIKAYADSIGHPLNWPVPGFGGILRALSARSLVLLGCAETAGHSTESAEWFKFERLYQESLSDTETLAEIENLVV